MCDTLVALKDSTKNKKTIFAKNSDRAANEPQYFTIVPEAEHEKGSMVKCTFIEIEQASHTNAVILGKPSWIWGAEIGINQYGVCIGNESVYTKEPREEPALCGMDIVRIGLERAATAKDALKVMTCMLEKYGQGGNCSFDAEYYYDNGYMIADSNEAWVLETAGRYWAAKKVEKAFSISNFLSITQPDFIHNSAISHAKACGWTVDERFDFAKAYIDWEHPGNHNGMVRKISSDRLLYAGEGSLTLENILEVLRCHTTDQPFLSGHFSICKHAVSGAAPHQTTNSLMAVLDETVENTVIWGSSMSIPCISTYKPFWLDAYCSDFVFSYDEQERAMDYWLKREEINRSIIEGRLDIEAYQAELTKVQESWFQMAENAAKDDRKELSCRICKDEEEFIQKWLKISSGKKVNFLKSGDYAAFWAQKNKELGENRVLVY